MGKGQLQPRGALLSVTLLMTTTDISKRTRALQVPEHRHGKSRVTSITLLVIVTELPMCLTRAILLLAITNSNTGKYSTEQPTFVLSKPQGTLGVQQNSKAAV